MNNIIYWLILMIAILFETGGTVSMKLSHGFTRIVPTITMFAFYGIGIALMATVLKKIDVSIVYAIWSGLGTVLITLIGVLWFEEKAPPIKILSTLLIVIGIVGLHLSSEH